MAQMAVRVLLWHFAFRNYRKSWTSHHGSLCPTEHSSPVVQWEHFPCEGTANKQKTDPCVNAAKQIVTADTYYHEVEFWQIQTLLPDLISATSYEHVQRYCQCCHGPCLGIIFVIKDYFKINYFWKTQQILSCSAVESCTRNCLKSYSRN